MREVRSAPASFPALRRFETSFSPLTVDDAIVQSFHEDPLDSDARRALYLMGSVERDSSYQFENAMAARLATSKDIAVFLPLWAQEEAQHGRILLDIAAASGERANGEDTARALKPTMAQRTSVARSTLAGRLMPNLRAAYGVFGAYQEHSVIIAYGLLATRVNDVRLSNVLSEIVSQERRHLAVYRAIARAELPQSKGARIVARRCMQHLWKPVGYEAMGSRNWQWLLGYLCPTDVQRRRLCRSDDALRGLPGVDDLAPMNGFLMRSGILPPPHVGG